MLFQFWDNTDLRCGIDSLAAIIERKYKVNLFVPNTLFLFCGRSSTRIKGLLWEGDGFLLLYKRVEQGRFVWPRTSEELRQLRPEQFKWLMQGFALDPLIYDIQPGYSAWFCIQFFVQNRDFYSAAFPSVSMGAVHSLSRPLSPFCGHDRLYTALFFLFKALV